MSVDTRKAEHRPLHFETLADVLADAEAVTAGPHRTTGNWSAGQIIEHLAFFVDMSARGSDVQPPAVVKVVGRLLKRLAVHRRPIKPGLKPPGKMGRAITSPPDKPVDEAIDHLRTAVTYAQTHGMPHPSPLFGRLSQDDWRILHCRHAEMHLGFIHPARGDETRPEA